MYICVCFCFWFCFLLCTELLRSGRQTKPQSREKKKKKIHRDKEITKLIKAQI